MSSDFKKLVERCARRDENHTIFNASKDHAYILFDNLLKKSLETDRVVKIFSGCFQSDFYEKLIDITQEALNAGITVSIIAQYDDSLHDNKFYTLVKNHKNGNARVLQDKNTHIPHFILVGKVSYRIETDDALKSARANFNDANTGEVLASTFNTLQQNAA